MPRKQLVRPHGYLVFATLVLGVGAVGCGKAGPPLATVSGLVTLDGQPVDRGTILFVPMKGTKGPVAGGMIEDGRYEQRGKIGVAIGWNQVQISSSGKTGRMVPDPFSSSGALTEDFAERVAPQFNSATTLTLEVKPGTNTANFEVTSIGR